MDFVMDCFNGDSFAEFSETHKSIVQPTQRFRTECKVQYGHSEQLDISSEPRIIMICGVRNHKSCVLVKTTVSSLRERSRQPSL